MTHHILAAAVCIRNAIFQRLGDSEAFFGDTLAYAWPGEAAIAGDVTHYWDTLSKDGEGLLPPQRTAGTRNKQHQSSSEVPLHINLERASFEATAESFEV